MCPVGGNNHRHLCVRGLLLPTLYSSSPGLLTPIKLTAEPNSNCHHCLTLH